MKNSYLYSALVAAVSISAAQAEGPEANGRVKCYGIAKAGENDCWGTSKDGEYHECPSWSTEDNDPYAWAYLEKEECLSKGGKLNPPPLPPKKPEATE